MSHTPLRPFLRSLFLALAGAFVAASAQTQTAACPATCDGSASIARHGGESDRYWQLEATDVGSTFTWQCVDPCPEDPFTEFDGLSTPNERVTQVNRMLERTYMVTVESERGADRCACVDVTPYEGNFPFLAIADPQFGLLQPRQHPFLYESRLLDRAIDTANRQQVAFVAVLGDMVHKHNDADQLATYEDRMARLDKSIPLIEVPGNHDINNKPTVTTLTNYRNRRGDDYYSFSYANSRFFTINSTLLDVRRHMSTSYWETHGPAIDLENVAHRSWLTANLPTSPGVNHRIVFSHHPLFKTSPDEPHQSSQNLDFEARNHLLGQFRQHQVNAVFAGHDHNHQGPSVFDDPPNCNPCDPFEMITSSRVNHTPSTAGFRLVNVFDDRIVHEFFPIDLPPTLIAGSSWRYLDDVPSASSPPAGWQAANFDDAAWLSGTAVLGYGAIPDLNTEIHSGSVPPVPTAYFRTSFEIDDPTAFAQYRLGVWHDDGAVVYVDGQEVFRPNMPSGTISHNTPASSPVVGAPQAPSFLPDGLTPDELAAGTNVLAVEVHQAGFANAEPTLDDLAFDFELRGESPSTLIARRSLWRFNDFSDRAPSPNNGGKNWFESGYSFNGWTLAEAPIGDLDALPGSAVDCGPDDPEACGVTTEVETSAISDPCFSGAADETRTTTYFRQAFEVQDPMAFATYTLELLANDGAVVYLNGVKIWQPNMPDTTVDHCTLALSDFGAPGLYASFQVSPSDLQPGSNLLAIEVHRRAAQTDDMVFDLELTGSNP